MDEFEDYAKYGGLGDLNAANAYDETDSGNPDSLTDLGVIPGLDWNFGATPLHGFWVLTVKNTSTCRSKWSLTQTPGWWGRTTAARAARLAQLDAFGSLLGRTPPKKGTNSMRKKLAGLLLASASALMLAVPAFAFDCTVAKKPPTAGAVAIVDINTGETTFLKRNPGTEEKPHGAFVALTDGSFTTSTFIHAPGGVLPPAREGGSQHNCDGKGIDSLEVCFGG